MVDEIAKPGPLAREGKMSIPAPTMELVTRAAALNTCRSPDVVPESVIPVLVVRDLL